MKPLLMLVVAGKGGTMGAMVVDVEEVLDIDDDVVAIMLEIDDVASIVLLLLLELLLVQTAPFAATPKALLQFSG